MSHEWLLVIYLGQYYSLIKCLSSTSSNTYTINIDMGHKVGFKNRLRSKTKHF